MKLNLTIRNPKLVAVQAALSEEGRTGISQLMGDAIRETTRDHLAGLALTRHATAQRLGGTPTGFLAEAARAVEGSPVTATATQATLTINHVGMIRALRDVTIVPKKAKALTIPIAGIAYGRTAAEMRAEGHEMFVLGGKGQDLGRNILAERLPDGSVLPLFLLVRSVTQKQDRTLLPSNEEWEGAAGKAVAEYLEAIPD